MVFPKIDRGSVFCIFPGGPMSYLHPPLYGEGSSCFTISASVIVNKFKVGYWMFCSFPNDPFPQPTDSDSDLEGRRFYLKRLVTWADRIGLKVILDLHGAPGSQNGMDHSGRRGKVIILFFL